MLALLKPIVLTFLKSEKFKLFVIDEISISSELAELMLASKEPWVANKKVIEEIFEAIQFGESSLTLKQVQDNHQIH